MLDHLKKIEAEIKYEFKNPSLLTEALTHKSFCIEQNQVKPDNERLEFLGDAILNFVIAEDLFQLFPQDAEGFLSKKRASLVNQDTLYKLALNCGLSEEIILGPGERKQNSHLKPRILGSCFEALIGAVYLDSGFLQAKTFVLSHFKHLGFQLDEESGFETDYKTRLQEVTQKNKLGAPTYELLLTKGPPHHPTFLIALKLNNEEMTRAEGASKKKAEQLAARTYLNQITNGSKNDL